MLNEISETTVLISESSVQTNNAADNLIIEKTLAGFIHRSDTSTSETECKVRSRLTPSGPSKAGSMWFNDPAPVSNGFDTYFTFQISDHSKQCTQNKDQYFSLSHHLTCSVHGADGFAFVLQRQDSPENSTSIVGQVGGQMGERFYLRRLHFLDKVCLIRFRGHTELVGDRLRHVAESGYCTFYLLHIS